MASGSSVDMNIILMAQGECTRFPGKHFAKVCGRPILQRTIGLIREISSCARIILVSPSEEAFIDLNCDLLWTQPKTGSIQSGVYNLREAWNYGISGDSRIVLGDVVWSYEYLKTFLSDRRSGVFYGRIGPNSFTGCPWGEVFGIVVGGRPDLLYDGLVTQKGKNLHELWLAVKRKGGLWQQCEDWTDDIDFPRDLEGLEKHCQTVKGF
jgi:hypothetical protein